MDNLDNFDILDLISADPDTLLNSDDFNEAMNAINMDESPQASPLREDNSSKVIIDDKFSQINNELRIDDAFVREVTSEGSSPLNLPGSIDDYAIRPRAYGSINLPCGVDTKDVFVFPRKKDYPSCDYANMNSINDAIRPRVQPIANRNCAFSMMNSENTFNFPKRTSDKPFVVQNNSNNENFTNMVIDGSVTPSVAVTPSVTPHYNTTVEKVIPVVQKTNQSVKSESKRTVPSCTKVPTQQRTTKYKHRKIRDQPNKCYHLWDFLKDLLKQRVYPNHRCVEWTDENDEEFRIIDTKLLAKLWGNKKNSENMTYDKLSRTIRYYCSLNILVKTNGKRLQFKFGQGKMWSKASSS